MRTGLKRALFYLYNKQIQYLRLVSRAADLFYNLTVLENDEGGNGEYSKLLGKGGVFIHVNLCHGNVLPLTGDLIHNGKDHTAGAAPIRIEVKKGYALIFSYFPELILIDLNS